MHTSHLIVKVDCVGTRARRRRLSAAHSRTTTTSMSSPGSRALLALCACATALLVRVCADSVCSEDIFGVLQGTPHKLPEHYLLPRVFDWAVAVPSVCGGEFTAGVEARVCTAVQPPSVRIVDFSAAVVHAVAQRPSYLVVNVTVYCSSHQVATAAPASIDSSAFESGHSLRATPLLRNTPQPYWALV